MEKEQELKQLLIEIMQLMFQKGEKHAKQIMKIMEDDDWLLDPESDDDELDVPQKIKDLTEVKKHLEGLR